LAAVKFAPAETAKPEDGAASEEVARRRSAAPSTVPNDAEVITALTEGERRIAEKNPRAAEVSFQKVLTKYPDQARAWYGIGLVALLDHDAARAKQVFGRSEERRVGKGGRSRWSTSHEEKKERL